MAGIMPRGLVVRVAALAAALGAALLAPGAASAHTLAPEEIIAGLRVPAIRDAYGIEDVSRLDGLPRLLLVRVGARWREVDPERRRELAENWSATWRHSVPEGVVSIVDARSGDSVVSFDGFGHARVR